MPTLSDLASQLNIDTKRPFFPVNSLRLFYFLISNYYTDPATNPSANLTADSDPETIRNKITAVLPLIDYVLESRTQHHTSNPQSTAQEDFEAAQEPLQKLFAFAETPGTHLIFTQLFTYLYPLQDSLLSLTYQEIMAEKKLAVSHLDTVLKIRAMDSIIFSTVLAEVIPCFNICNPHIPNLPTDLDRQALNYHINLIYQFNDLVDAIVFAKDDMEANNFSPFQVIRRIAPEAPVAKELVKAKLAEFQEKSKLFPFPPKLQENTQLFYQALTDVVQGN